MSDLIVRWVRKYLGARLMREDRPRLPTSWAELGATVKQESAHLLRHNAVELETDVAKYPEMEPLLRAELTQRARALRAAADFIEAHIIDMSEHEPPEPPPYAPGTLYGLVRRRNLG